MPESPLESELEGRTISRCVVLSTCRAELLDSRLSCTDRGMGLQAQSCASTLAPRILSCATARHIQHTKDLSRARFLNSLEKKISGSRLFDHCFGRASFCAELDGAEARVAELAVLLFGAPDTGQAHMTDCVARSSGCCCDLGPGGVSVKQGILSFHAARTKPCRQSCRSLRRRRVAAVLQAARDLPVS